ncbi:MAG: type II secretion system F family protein [Sedimentisphaerales bacterium]|nr:type II secretion system F family protein [Sedimentisphaerales bacterium]
MAKGLATVYDNLSTLLAAGVPLIRSLRTVSAGLKGRLRQVFAKATSTVEKGMPLSEAMSLHPKVFARLDIMIIHAAEESGNLAEALDMLGHWYEFSRRIRNLTLASLALPILMAHLAAVIYPVPALVWSDWDFAAYRRTALLIVLVLCYIPAALIICIIRFTPQTGAMRRIVDRISLRMPLFLGRALRKLALSRYCWIFHMTSQAGMPITECSEMAANGAGNMVVADLFMACTASVKAGNSFSDGLSPKLPPEFVEPWRIGEETGRLDEISKRLAQKNGEDAEFWFKQFAVWFPRAYYGVIAAVMIVMVFKGYANLYGGLLNP